MKNSELKTALSAAFAAPEPERKRAFFRALPPAPVSHFAFMRSQAGYIRRSTWALSAASFAFALGVGRYAPEDALWSAAALTPFAALTAVTEGGRSALYGMEELEMSSRMGLKSVVLARMGLIGLAHLLLLCLLAPLARRGTETGLFSVGVYLLTPYLLTTLLGLGAVRRIRGREAIYVCGAMAVLVSGLLGALSGSYRALYAPENFRWWLAALALCAALTATQWQKNIRRTEDLTWNL